MVEKKVVRNGQSRGPPRQTEKISSPQLAVLISFKFENIADFNFYLSLSVNSIAESKCDYRLTCFQDIWVTIYLLWAKIVFISKDVLPYNHRQTQTVRAFSKFFLSCSNVRLATLSSYQSFNAEKRWHGLFLINFKYNRNVRSFLLWKWWVKCYYVCDNFIHSKSSQILVNFYWFWNWNASICIPFGVYNMLFSDFRVLTFLINTTERSVVRNQKAKMFTCVCSSR